MDREKYIIDHKEFLEGEFVLLNGIVGVYNFTKGVYCNEQMFEEQAFIKYMRDGFVYLNPRDKCSKIEQYSKIDPLGRDKDWVIPFHRYRVKIGECEIKKANIYETPPKGFVYTNKDTSKPCDLLESWIMCIVLMLFFAMFKPVFVWSLCVLILFLIYRHNKIKELRDYNRNKEHDK